MGESTLSEHWYMYTCQVIRDTLADMAAPDPSETLVPARQRNARGEGDKLRDQLLDATVALLDAEGDAERISVRAIAKAAGVSPTALYMHFPDRDALVEAAIDRGFGAFNAAILEADDAHDEPRARIRAMGHAYLAFSERQPALYAVIFSSGRPKDHAAPDRAVKSPAVDRDEALVALVTAVTAASPGAGADEVRDRAMALWAALHGFATLCGRPTEDPWPTAESYVERVLAAHVP